jgi:hypothetical protein
MSKQSINTLKNWFRTGLKPTQSQFRDWLDSFFHKDFSKRCGYNNSENKLFGLILYK